MPTALDLIRSDLEYCQDAPLGANPRELQLWADHGNLLNRLARTLDAATRALGDPLTAEVHQRAVDACRELLAAAPSLAASATTPSYSAVTVLGRAASIYLGLHRRVVRAVPVVREVLSPSKTAFVRDIPASDGWLALVRQIEPLAEQVGLVAFDSPEPQGTIPVGDAAVVDLLDGGRQALLHRPHANAFEVRDTRIGSLICGHPGSYSLARAYDGERHRIATANGSDIDLWDARTGATLLTLRDHEAGVTALAFAPGGRVLASAGLDGTICLWDTDLGRRLRLIAGGMYTRLALARPWTIVAARDDGLVDLWDGDTCRQVASLGQPSRSRTSAVSAVSSIATSPDGRMLLAADVDGVVRIWDLEDRTCLGKIDAPQPEPSVSWGSSLRFVIANRTCLRLHEVLWEPGTAPGETADADWPLLPEGPDVRPAGAFEVRLDDGQSEIVSRSRPDVDVVHVMSEEETRRAGLATRTETPEPRAAAGPALMSPADLRVDPALPEEVRHTTRGFAVHLGRVSWSARGPWVMITAFRSGPGNAVGRSSFLRRARVTDGEVGTVSFVQFLIRRVESTSFEA